MPLYEIRNRFIQSTGRLDLGTIGDESTGVDGGADKFINDGQRYLDELAPTNFLPNARLQKDIAVGVFYIDTKDCRSIKYVAVTNSNGSKTLLKINDKQELYCIYGKPFAEVPRGCTIHYCVDPSKLSPEQDDLNPGNIDSVTTRDIEDIQYYDCDETECRRILLMPPTDQLLTVKVYGLFWSRKLVDNCDKSFWTERYADLLVTAAQFQLENFYRNTEGMRDKMEYIKSVFRGIDNNLIEEEMASVEELRG